MFLCIDMLVCLHAMRRDRNAETRVIHLVMPHAIFFSSTHLGVTSGVASSRNCRDLSDSPGHASSIWLRVASVLALSHKCKDLNDSPGHAAPFCYVILRCGVGIAHVNVIRVTSRVASQQRCREQVHETHMPRLLRFA